MVEFYNVFSNLPSSSSSTIPAYYNLPADLVAYPSSYNLFADLVSYPTNYNLSANLVSYLWWFNLPH